MAGVQYIALRLSGIGGNIGADVGYPARAACGGLSYKPRLFGQRGGHFRSGGGVPKVWHATGGG